MKALILGANGMLGQAIYRCFQDSEIELISIARHDADYCFDLTNDTMLRQCIYHVMPDVVINTAAIVNLEYCEDNPGEAYRINSRIPGVVAQICKECCNYFIQISTDHYYTGDGKSKHAENIPVKIVNEYARTKYAGEQLALTYENSLVLRTNIVGFRGSGKPTFLEWALSNIENEQSMNLFSDFFTSSICTSDFARILLDVIDKHPVGIYNLASSEVTSKRDFIIGLSEMLFGRVPLYCDAQMSSLPGLRRAESLGLDTSKLEQLLGYRMPDFHDTLESIKMNI